MSSYSLNHLEELEAEAIFVIREVAAQFENPAILFSGGKDSIVVSYLARKAFYPANIPFPLLHIDTGHNFQETLDYRDNLAKEFNARLIVGHVQEMIDKGMANDEKGVNASRNIAQIPTLLQAIETHKFDALIGGARRDEEKARAKERFFSHRDEFGQWDPKNQRPELWNIFNGRKHLGEHFRVFPISNWTELDVWQYIAKEKILLPSLYFAHKRRVFNRDGTWLSESPYTQTKENEVIEEKMIRFRTMGDITITGAYLSEASNLDEVIQEIAASLSTERGTRADDKRSETAMEDRKKEGYF
ncbi:MAG: sulfate adenylyltransferase subunit CysD [Chitinophagales bacterium]|nr:sulfate adenylyltransferase subunit CysD [Chitinophagales bacterium]